MYATRTARATGHGSRFRAGQPGGLRVIYNLVVVDLLTDERADALFHALADRTRRDILRRVIDTEQSVSALARHYPMSITAVQKHVAALEGAGLVLRRKSGREQIVRAEITGVRTATTLLDELEALWRARLSITDEILNERRPSE